MSGSKIVLNSWRFHKKYNEESDEGYFLEVDVQYLEKLHEIHNDLPFLPEWVKIRQIEKLVANLHEKTEYVIHIRNLKQELNQGLVLEKVHRVIKFNQNAWLKRYIDMNTDLWKKTKNDFKKYFFKLMQFLEKLWKMWEKIEILNFSRQKEERII